MCTIWNLLGSSNSGIRLLLPRMRSHSKALQYLAVVFGSGSSVTVLWWTGLGRQDGRSPLTSCLQGYVFPLYNYQHLADFYQPSLGWLLANGVEIYHTFKSLDSDIESRLVVAKGRSRERVDWEFGVSRCKLFCKWINIKILLYSTGNYIQYPTINHHGKEYKKIMHVYVSLNHFAVQQELTQHCTSTMLP